MKRGRVKLKLVPAGGEGNICASAGRTRRIGGHDLMW